MQPVPPSTYCDHRFYKEIPRTSPPKLKHMQEAYAYAKTRTKRAPYGFETVDTNQCQRCGMPKDQWVIPEHLLPKPSLPPEKKKRWWQR